MEQQEEKKNSKRAVEVAESMEGEAERTEFVYMNEHILPQQKPHTPVWKKVLFVLLGLVVIALSFDYGVSKGQIWFGESGKEGTLNQNGDGSNAEVNDAAQKEWKSITDHYWNGTVNQQNGSIGQQSKFTGELGEFERYLVGIKITNTGTGKANRMGDVSYAAGTVIAVTQSAILIMTDYSSVKYASELEIMFCDGEKYPGDIKAYDTRSGVSLLEVPKMKISSKTLRSVRTASWRNPEKINSSEEVIFVRCLADYERMVSAGYVQEITEKIITDGVYHMLYTSILHSGNGVLMDQVGNILGIAVYNPDGSNTTFCSSTDIRPLVEKMINGETFSYVGIHGVTVTEEIKSWVDASMPSGVYVQATKLDSPAYHAGILNGDIITGIDGDGIATVWDFQNAIEKLEPGQVITVSVMRQGSTEYKSYDLEVTVGMEE